MLTLPSCKRFMIGYIHLVMKRLTVTVLSSDPVARAYIEEILRNKEHVEIVSYPRDHAIVVLEKNTSQKLRDTLWNY